MPLVSLRNHPRLKATLRIILTPVLRGFVTPETPLQDIRTPVREMLADMRRDGFDHVGRPLVTYISPKIDDENFHACPFPHLLSHGPLTLSKPD